MKKLLKFLFIALIFFACEKVIRTQTDGFRVEKTLADFPNAARWETTNELEVEGILAQDFYFLGSGVQCYAFLSEDGQNVLKVFKHYHLCPSSTNLQKLPELL